MIKKIIFIILGIIGGLLLLEISVIALVYWAGLNILLPTYNLNSPEFFLPERSHIYGHRHRPNSTFELQKNCLQTLYRFNSLGFRDENHSLSSNKSRVVVLGDSFMEGLAVEEENRVSDLLENKTGITHLNFAMSDKGSTQSYVIYDSIASKYDHDAVLLSVFPINDFIDDDPTIGKNSNSIRPCWTGQYPNYELKFFPDSAPTFKKTVHWKHWLKSFTHSYDALFYLKESLKSLLKERNYPKTGYFSFSQQQLNRMKYSLLKIKEKAGSKSITLVSIPSHLSFEKEEGISVETPLQSFCDSIGIQFIGLFQPFKNASNSPEKEFYYRCDSHWNEAGHQLAFEIIIQNSSIYE